MTEDEIEKEVIARLEFKTSEIITIMKNMIKLSSSMAFGSIIPGQSQYHQERVAMYSEVIKMIEKEMMMGVPSDTMHEDNIRMLKDKSVDKIMEKLDRHFRGKMDPETRHSIVQTVVSAVESAQRLT